MIWTILIIISVLLLVFYFKSRNAVWGGFSIGIVLGFVVALVVYFQGFGFSWPLVGKFIVVCTLTGFGAELLGKLGNILKRK